MTKISHEYDPASLASLQSAVEDLQIRLEFQADSLAALDKVVAGQDQLLLIQQRQLLLLADKLKQLEGRVDQDTAVAVEPPPPHY